MSTSDSDEDLRTALAISMGQHPPHPWTPPARHQDAVDLTAETNDEDEDLREAIALSLTEAGPTMTSEENTMNEDTVPVSTTSAVMESTLESTIHLAHHQEASGPLGILDIDRKAMEQERLARLCRRKRQPSPELATQRPGKMRAAGSTQRMNTDPRSARVVALQHPAGVIKRTYARYYPRTDDITIEEVLQADLINIAVISSFQWDSEWLNKKLNPVKVKQIWIMNAKGGAVQDRWRAEMRACGIPNLRLHFPPMDGMIHSMHSKFMLLFGKEHLRLVVPTANMTPIDWGETQNDRQPGLMENSVFLIDLPRKENGTIGTKKDLTSFGQELLTFLEKQKIDPKVVEGVLKHDFAQTQYLAFVHSIAGAHSVGLERLTGLPGLANAVRGLQSQDVQHVELDYAASSLGAINDTLLQRMWLAAHGEPFSTASVTKDVRNHIRIYFPTDETVQRSTGGPDCGGIISLTSQYFHASTFPRECLRNYDSTRRGMLSHNKLLFARGRLIGGKPFAWVYVGSANLSESAWGGQKVLKSGQMGSLNLRNWECGVIMPVSDEHLASLKLGEDEVPSMDVFGSTIEVPFVYPGEAHGDSKPWLFK